jgi:hypothetical protein
MRMPGGIRSWTLAGLAAVVIGWTSYLQMRATVLDGCYANGDPGADEVLLAFEISVLAGIVVSGVVASTRGWAAALGRALLTPIACMVLSWCIGNAAFVLIRAVACPNPPTYDPMTEPCGICRT